MTGMVHGHGGRLIQIVIGLISPVGDASKLDLDGYPFFGYRLYRFPAKRRGVWAVIGAAECRSRCFEKAGKEILARTKHR